MQVPRRLSGGLNPNWQGIDGIQLFMQPVQDLTVDARVTRTQFQYTLRIRIRMN